VNCLAVRDRLTEHALGVLALRDAAVVDRHLAWCAACRKESGDLHRAAVTLAFAVAPADPSPELEDHVLASVKGAVGVHPTRGSRGRVAVAAVVAAMVAVAGLGWGAVMAGRAARFEDRVKIVRVRDDTGIENFLNALGGIRTADAKARLADLQTRDASPAGGAALTLLSPSSPDVVVIMVSGLGERPAPYVVELRARGGRRLRVGTMRRVDADGAARLTRNFEVDLSPYDRVVVLDASGATVLSGTFAVPTSIPSPSPSSS
jgi:hypothetical protein